MTYAITISKQMECSKLTPWIKVLEALRVSQLITFYEAGRLVIVYRAKFDILHNISLTCLFSCDEGNSHKKIPSREYIFV
jgi:hypothetical protein